MVDQNTRHFRKFETDGVCLCSRLFDFSLANFEACVLWDHISKISKTFIDRNCIIENV